MKRTVLALILIAALIFSAATEMQIVDLARADPFIWMGDIPPDHTTKPPKITILSPENKTYANNNVSLAFNVSAPKQETPVTGLIYSPSLPVLPIYTSRVEAVYYKADWQQDDQHVDIQYDEWHGTYLTEFSFNLTEIPEGNHSITVHATGTGLYGSPGSEAYTFSISGASSVSFAIDTTSPIISVLSLENKTYETSDVPLNFTINEPVSEIKYSLDGQENVTVSGNVTLTDLLNGEHNVTVYSTDEAGNLGSSETMIFTVAKPEPFPTTLVITASGASAVAIGIGMLFYFRRRKKLEATK